MPIDSSKNLPESVKDQDLSEDDIRELMDQFRVSFRKIKVDQREVIMKRLKKKNPGKNVTAVTWPQANAEIEINTRINKTLSTIKKGGVANVFDEIRELAGIINFKDYAIESCEPAIKRKIEDLLLTGQIEKAREIVNLFENYFDFIPEIKSIHMKYRKKGKNNDTANRIKNAFPEIDFGS